MHIVLHIGSDKTGSTYIQRMLSRNSDVLARQGICYPKLDRRNNHESLAVELRHSSKGDAWKKLERAVGTGPRILFLSSEMFCSFAAVEIERLRDWLDFPDAMGVTVICYLRSCDQYLESSVSQQLKNTKSHREFRRLYHRATKVPFFVNPLAYRISRQPAFVLRWLDSFHPTTAIVRPYDENSWPDGDILKDLLTSLDMTDAYPPGGQTEPRINLTPDVSLLYAIQELNRAGLAQLRHRFLEVSASRLGETKTLPITSYALRRFSQFLSRRTVRRIEKQLGTRLPTPEVGRRRNAPSISRIRSEALSVLARFAGHEREENRELREKIQRQYTSRS